jgi:hypothetical protein
MSSSIPRANNLSNDDFLQLAFHTEKQLRRFQGLKDLGFLDEEIIYLLTLVDRPIGSIQLQSLLTSMINKDYMQICNDGDPAFVARENACDDDTILSYQLLLETAAATM